jgi:hypothetical protein
MNYWLGFRLHAPQGAGTGGATTKEQRREIVDQLQQIFSEVVPYIPIGQFTRPIAFRKTLKGVLPDSWDLTLWNIEKTGN